MGTLSKIRTISPREWRYMLLALLRRVGINSHLRIGVDKLGGALKAHAWLEKDGVVLNDSLAGIERFFPFDQAFDPAMFDTP